MIGQIAVIASRADPASSNIAERLMELARWEDGEGYQSCDNYRLVIIDEPLISLCGLEERLADLGLAPELLVFTYRHQAKDERPRLCGHFTGNVGEATLGGSPRRLAVAAPRAFKSFIKNLCKAPLGGFEISAEATHHGPTDLAIPSFFAEIGSTEREWPNPKAGLAVAKAIMGLRDIRSEAFLSFGGGHYVRRQNRLLVETGICFGHLFSNYQVDDLDLELIEEASINSGARYAYLDKKSLRSAAKKKLAKILKDLDLEAMNGKEIWEQFPPED